MVSKPVTVEIRVGKDGSVELRVLDAKGKRCLEATRELEDRLGVVTRRQLLPSYYEVESVDVQSRVRK